VNRRYSGDDFTRNRGINSGYMQELPALMIFTDFSPPKLGVACFEDGWRHVLSKE